MLQESIANYWSSLDTVQKGVAQGAISGIAQGIEQGIELGKEEGRVEGCLESLHPVMTRLVQIRFPGVAILTQQQAIHIKDPGILKMLVDSLIMARTEDEAMRLLTGAIEMNKNQP